MTIGTDPVRSPLRILIRMILICVPLLLVLVYLVNDSKRRRERDAAEVDRGRARRALSNAYYARAIGVSMMSSYSDAFSSKGPEAVAAAAKSDVAVALLKEMKAATNAEAPVTTGKDAVLGTVRELKGWYDVIAEPRGTWLTYQTDLATARRTLDSAIRLLEEVVRPSEWMKSEAETQARDLERGVISRLTKEQEALAEAAAKAEQAEKEAAWQRDFVLRQKEREEARLADLRNATPTPTTEAVEQDRRRIFEERELVKQRRRIATEWEAKFDAANERVAIAAHKLRQQESAAPPVRLSDPPTPFETSAKKARDLQLEPYRSALDAAQEERGRLLGQRPPGAGNPYRDALRSQ